MKRFNVTIAPIRQDQKPAMGSIHNYFIPTGLTTQEFFQFVTQPYSYTWAPAIYSGSIEGANWVSQQIIALDFDNKPKNKKKQQDKKKVKVQDVLEKLTKVGIIPNIYYHTFSHTEEHPRFRIVFILENSIVNSDDYDKILRLLFRVLGATKDTFGVDELNRDKARRFHGGLNGKVLEENLHSVTSLVDKLNIAVIACDHGKTRYVEDLSENTFHYSNVDSKSNQRQKWTYTTTSQVATEQIDINNARKNVKLLDEFLKGTWLTHQQLFCIATNMRYINGGRKLMKVTMEKYNNEGKTQYTENNFAMLTYVWSKSYPPQNIYEVSEYPEDQSVYDIITEVKYIRGKIDIIETDKKMCLTKAEILLRKHFKDALEALDNGIYIIKCPTGLGKSEILTNMVPQHCIVGFPTNELKDEMSSRFKTQHYTTPELGEFENSELNGRIAHLYKIGLVKNATRELHMVAEGKGYYSNNDINRAQEYIMSLEQAKRTEETILTTHKKIFNSKFPQETIVFDEDPLNELLGVKYLDLRDLSLIQDSEIRKVFDYLRSVPRNTIVESKCFGLDAEELSKRLDLNVLSSNIFDYLSSNFCIVDKGGMCYYTSQNKLSKNKKYVILSATASEDFYKMLYGERVKFIDLSSVVQQGSVLQYTRRSCSRQGLSVYHKTIAHQLGHLPVITFKSIKSEFANSVPIHFGNCCGYDMLKGKDVAVVGTPHVNNIKYLLSAKMLEIELQDTSMRYQEVQHNGFRFVFNSFTDENLRKVQFHFIESELIQAVGRARTIRTNANVSLYSNFPLKVSSQFIY